MYNLEPKKLALIRIYEILLKNSDEFHPLTHEKIIKKLDNDYGIVLERKAIGRNLSLLKEVGVEIETKKNGSYISERLFEDSEIKLLIDGVLSSKHISPKHSKDLIEKLCGLSNKYFKKRVKYIYSLNEWDKESSSTVFYNIDFIDEAIEKGEQIEFDYNKYGVDKKLQKSSRHKVSPVQFLLHNQKYYLMAINEKWKDVVYYRVDRLSSLSFTGEKITKLKEVKGYENGVNYSELSTAYPYMFSDKIERIEMFVDDIVIDQVIDWFGKDLKIVKVDDRYKITLRASLKAMEFWAMQYLNFVEIIHPKALRETIKNNILSASEKYKN